MRQHRDLNFNSRASFKNTRACLYDALNETERFGHEQQCNVRFGYRTQLQAHPFGHTMDTPQRMVATSGIRLELFEPEIRSCCLLASGR